MRAIRAFLGCVAAAWLTATLLGSGPAPVESDASFRREEARPSDPAPAGTEAGVEHAERGPAEAMPPPTETRAPRATPVAVAVRGVVVDERGRPVADARVTARERRDAEVAVGPFLAAPEGVLAEATADRLGAFDLALSSGRVRIEAERDGYGLRAPVDVVVRPGATDDVRLVLEP